MTKEEIIKGISAYHREQAVLLRLIRMKKGLTQQDFDKLFRGREWRRPMKLGLAISGDSFLMGGMSGSCRDWWLDLLQYMMRIGLIDTTRTEHGIVYSLTDEVAP